jgi:hypothetical protein
LSDNGIASRGCDLVPWLLEAFDMKVLPFTRRAAIACVLVLLAAGASRAQEPQPSALRGWVPPTPGFLVEPPLLRKLVNASDGAVSGDGEPLDGPYADFGHMVTGAGWISAGPGYRRHIAGGRAMVDASAALSWNLYQVVQARVELPHLAGRHLRIGGQAMYQDLGQVEYFGLGATSREADRSVYRFRNLDVLGYADLRATRRLTFSARGGWIPTPELSAAGGWRVRAPNTIDTFTDQSAPGLLVQPSMLHADISAVVNWLDHPGHPTRGGLYRATAASYWDRDAGTYTFRRYEVEASQFLPLAGPRWILALHGWEVFSDASPGHAVPFYLMPSLGGKNTLRGFDDYRFHDADMQVFNVESRWPLFAHIDAAVFADAGKVAPRAGDLDFRHLEHAYGVGFRVHNATSTILRLDVGRGTEGWHVFLKVSEPFKRSTPAFGRSSVVPFVP